MDNHPEQEWINVIIDGELAGVDQVDYEKYKEAKQKLSLDGQKELKKQMQEVIDDFCQKELLENMPANATRH